MDEAEEHNKTKLLYIVVVSVFHCLKRQVEMLELSINVLWYVTMMENYQHYGGNCWLLHDNVSCYMKKIFMKMEAVGSSKTLVIFNQTKRSHTPEDNNVHIHQAEDLNLT